MLREQCNRALAVHAFKVSAWRDVAEKTATASVFGLVGVPGSGDRGLPPVGAGDSAVACPGLEEGES